MQSQPADWLLCGRSYQAVVCCGEWPISYSLQEETRPITGYQTRVSPPIFLFQSQFCLGFVRETLRREDHVFFSPSFRTIAVKATLGRPRLGGTTAQPYPPPQSP
ncbi:Hypp1752 [Branchiostoma lanceolatum]|uniref:Hypp1752 protein n=1 Tax=Branchiostoma lanceolatum TaxID=7740 RepID=A0A8J9ZMD6_BRALA|nr:Hypp1752 [Branchiostoma lanceolatum]